MLVSGHRLVVGGESMIGRCIKQGQARIALDVGREAVRFDNPLLPETRSEMALPLRSRGQVIGAMTVQSKVAAAFDEAGVAIMQTMADQVAVAIDNARLFAETEAALKEMEAVHRSYLRETWSEYLGVAETTEYDTAGPGAVSGTEIERAVAGRGATVVAGPPPGQGGVAPQPALVAPIVLRDEMIGTLGIHDKAGGPPREWTEEERVLVEAVANRLALAAENLRLLDETRRRAAQERLISEVTARMRETLDVDAVLDTGVAEIVKTLGLAALDVRFE
jgi:GAF domain-containing protein